MKLSSSKQTDILVKPAIAFDSLPTEIRQQILFEAPGLEDFDEESEGFRLYDDKSRPINKQCLRTFSALLCASTALRPDLLFPAKKHLEILSY